MKTTHIILIALVLSLTSCSDPFRSKKEPMTSESSGESKDTPDRKSASAYYDFNDILVPKEMKLETDTSLVFESAQIKAGRIRFKGWVEPISLFDFFMTNMPQDNWKLRSYFKYGVYMLVFEKPDKDCIISINSKTLNTELEIWVTPRQIQK